MGIPIKVAVCGCEGRMGKTIVSAVTAADDMEVVCGIDPAATNIAADAPYDFPVFLSVEDALEDTAIDVFVDFTRPDTVEHNVRAALARSIDCVVGTTGMTEDQLKALAADAPSGTCLFYAPNFTTGAVLMMEFSRAAAPYFPEAEVIEFHHEKKADAPSGTAIRTAELIADARKEALCTAGKVPGKESEREGFSGARGAEYEGVHVHSVRSAGFVASQEVVFGSFGQTLTIRHDSWDRESYMPGVLLGIRSVGDRDGLIIGLENFMQD